MNRIGCLHTNVRTVTYRKGFEVYAFRYELTDEAVADLIRRFGAYASRPDLSFDWTDAMQLSAAVRVDYATRA